MDQPFFTIFTPVYNGEKHINRVFESINNQTFKNFEWIIINDGSTDKSQNLIKSFISQHPELNIIFIEQENSGKHIAWNKAVEIAKGQLFIPADADDSFLPEALSFFHQKWGALSLAEQQDLSGINVLCYDNETDNIVGDPFPIDGMKSSNLELEYKYKIKGEKWGCVRLDLLKTRPFPIVKSSYYPEGYLWLSIAKKYKAICINKALRRYFTTYTGISHTPLSERSVNQAKVLIKSSIWFLFNFGPYVLRYSPKVIYNTLAGIVLNVMVIIRRDLHIN